MGMNFIHECDNPHAIVRVMKLKLCVEDRENTGDVGVQCFCTGYDSLLLLRYLYCLYVCILLLLPFFLEPSSYLDEHRMQLRPTTTINCNQFYIITMVFRTAILASLVASAAAFAPASTVSRCSVPLE